MDMHKMNTKSVCLLAIVVVIILLFAQCRGALVDESAAIRALETHGFTGIEVKERNFWFISFRGGDRHDAARFKCEAEDPAGEAGNSICVRWMAF